MRVALPLHAPLSILLLGLLIGLLLPACRVPSASEPAQPPNIVLILADDVGYGDLGCYGQTKIHTPHLDALAATGVRWTQAYSAAPVCAPSRCAILTGRHMGHAAIRDNHELAPEGQQALPGGEITLAELLKTRGYATAGVGKWGLGPPGSEGDPLRQGFDHFYGYWCQRHAHSHYPTYLYDDGQRVELPGNDPKATTSAQYAPDLFLERAVRFLDEAKGLPFFLYYATTVPHVALQVPEDSLAEYRGRFDEQPYDGKQGYIPHPTPRAAYAAMITRLDRDVGRLREELGRRGMLENTLIVFTSDNGPTWAGGVDQHFFASAGGLRGQKNQLYEGGVRVPLILNWPARLTTASTCTQPVAGWDLFPTLAQAASVPSIPVHDGQDLLGACNAAAERELYFEHATGGWQALRMGDWKALRRNAIRDPAAPVELYNLAEDPAESRDRAAEQPELVQRALARFASRTGALLPQWDFPAPTR